MINGGVLQAIDGAGLPKVSNLLFSGNLAQNGYGAGLQGSGTFSRSLRPARARFNGPAMAALRPVAAS